jgi:hypothetical protein
MYEYSNVGWLYSAANKSDICTIRQANGKWLLRDQALIVDDGEA